MSISNDKHLCWFCNNYIDGCSWAREFKYPKNVVLDENKNIIKCPEFKAEQKRRIKTVTSKELALFVNKKRRTMFRHLYSTLINYFNAYGTFMYNHTIYDEEMIKYLKNAECKK